MIYVILNINGNIIGVADSPLLAVSLHTSRYLSFDWEFENSLRANKYETEFDLLVGIGRIQPFKLNVPHYQ